jgi:RNA polymerase sigma factor for flagellar operon FliA
MKVPSVSARKEGTISLEVRDRVVLEHLPLVKAIAIRVHENLPVHTDLDDLINAGVLGLFDAVAKFDRNKKVEFHSYAKHRIKGAILDSLRQLDWASRDMRKRQKQIDAVTRDLAAKLGRNPNEGELATEMGLSTDRLRHIQGELRHLGQISISRRDNMDNDRPQEFPATAALQPDRMCEKRELESTLARALGTLPARYQKVVFMYYTNEMTMKEIGSLLGVNESRISQIHKTALKKMAVALESQGIRSLEAFQPV